jgi:RNA polymerase I-specific transcription initiation factor RRN3
VQKVDQSTLTNNENEFNLKAMLENFLNNNENKFEFEYFLSVIKQKQSEPEFMLELLAQLRKCVDMLDPKVFETSIINLIFFDIKWQMFYSNNQPILAHLADFLIDLNSAYTSYNYKCLSMLIKMFSIANASSTAASKLDETASAKSEDLINCEALHNLAHNVMNHLLKVAPSCKAHITKLFDSLFPYMIKDTQIQKAYIDNLLKVAHRFKDIRLALLEICVQKMLKIDVNSRREQIIEAEQNNDSLVEFAENEISHVQIEEEAVKKVEEKVDDSPKPMKHPLADRLDVMMESFLSFIKTNSEFDQASTDSASNDQEAKLNWDSCKTVYRDLLFTFDKYILSTYGSSHVQFIMFYVCSYRSLLSEGFLDYLWKKFSAINSCAITRITCSYYLGSFLARAKYISLTTCVSTLQLMINWIHGYIEKQNTSSINNPTYYNFDLHRTFYALCQTVFYVVIFRNRQLFQEGHEEMVNLVKSWKLNEIVSCKLNPLRYCLPTIRKKFARVTYLNQIAYCYSIIDSNNRITLPISGQSSSNIKMFFSGQADSLANDKSKLKQSKLMNEDKAKKEMSENPLDSFFPFDPYLLNRSKGFIQKYYVEFQDVIDDDMEDDMDSDEDEEDDDSEDDDDEEDDDSNDDDDSLASSDEENKNMRNKSIHDFDSIDDTD